MLLEKRRPFFMLCLVVLLLIIIPLQVKQDLVTRYDYHYQRAFLTLKVNNLFNMAKLPEQFTGFIVALDVMPVSDGMLLLPLTILRMDRVVISQNKVISNSYHFYFLIVIIIFFFIFYRMSRNDQDESSSHSNYLYLNL